MMRTTKIQGGIIVAIFCTVLMVYAQSVELDIINRTSDTIAGMTATQLLALIAVMSLLFSLYMARNTFVQSNKHAETLNELVRELNQRPCIRRKEND
jgi:hypothetical protein